MANTSIHLPESLLEELDRLAAERSMSRNRLIVEACERVVEERSCWPGGAVLERSPRRTGFEGTPARRLRLSRGHWGGRQESYFNTILMLLFDTSAVSAP